MCHVAFLFHSFPFYMNCVTRVHIVSKCHIQNTEYRALYFHRVPQTLCIILPQKRKVLRRSAIADDLASEGETATRQGFARMLKRVERTGSLQRCPGSGQAI